MNINDITLINKFLDNELSEEELQQFKEKYGIDKQFKREVNILSLIHSSLLTMPEIRKETLTTEAFLNHLNNKKKRKEESIKNRSLTLYRIAAIVIPLIGLGGLIFPFIYTKPSDENLFAKYYAKPESQGSAKGISNEKPFDFQELQNKVDKTVNDQINVLNTNEELFSYAIYSMDNKHYNEAIIAFNQVLNSSNNILRPDSEWYLALCYLKTGNKDKSISILREIIKNKDHLHFRNAEKLLKKLR
jgi:tetratricopeptide (TPR) repeat protein